MTDSLRDATAVVAGAPRLNARGQGQARAGAGLAAERMEVGDLVAQAPLAIAVLRGPDHVYELANAPYLELVGRTASLVGIPIRAAFPDVEGQGVIEACDRVFQTGEPFTVHEMAVTFQRRTGTPEKRWFSFHITPVREAGAAGRADRPILGLIWVAADITEQIRSRRAIESAAKALARSERRFRSLVDCSDVTERVESQEARSALRIQRMLQGIGDAFAIYDRDWTILFVNQAATAAMGLSPADVIGKNFWELAPEAVGTRIHQELNRVLQTGQPATFEEHQGALGRWVDSTRARSTPGPASAWRSPRRSSNATAAASGSSRPRGRDRRSGSPSRPRPEFRGAPRDRRAADRDPAGRGQRRRRPPDQGSTNSG